MQSLYAQARAWLIQPRTLLALAALVVVALAAVIASRLAGPREVTGEVISSMPVKAFHGSPALPPVQVNAEQGSRPQAELSGDFYNFGAIDARAVVSHDFLVVNRGDAPLVIRRAYTTCGCTTAEISASVIPPGKAARATIIFDAGFHNTSGQTVRRGLVIETNDAERPQIEIWVQAAVGK